MKTLEFKITETGDLLGIYKDELRPLYDALGSASISRASDVEWEDIEWQGQGWTVRSHTNPKRALRWSRKYLWAKNCAIVVSEEGPIVFFRNREDALLEEVKNFWSLIGENNG